MTSTAAAGPGGPTRHGPRILASAAIGAALNPLNSTMVAVALPALSATFGAPASTTTLTVVAGFLTMTLVCQVPSGSIADRVGYGRTLAIGRWVLVLGALVSAFAPALWAVVVGRLIMAVGGSLMVPTAMALLRVAVAPERRQRAFGVLGMVMGGAAAVGPAAGAWITAHAGWRWLFLLNVPMLAASWFLHPSEPALDRAPHSHPAFDWIGSVLIGLVLVLLTYAARAAAPHALAAVGVTLVPVLLRHERRVPDPVLRVELFVERGFITAAGVIALQNLVMYSLLVQVPFLFGGTSAAVQARIGVAIIAMTGTMAITAPLGGWLAESVGAAPMVFAGGLAGAGGVIGLLRLPPGAGPLDVALRLLFVGLGLGLSMAPSQAVALTCAPAARSGVASATMTMLRYLGAIGGTVIVGYAFAGTNTAARQHAALWLFAGAFIASMGLAIAFPRLPALRRPSPGRA
ncbi:MAG TPA: MFS transporter [Vicinamibacterales bacterium]|nr:MFS transporter [Vicinamibacterales bacterium]